MSAASRELAGKKTGQNGSTEYNLFYKELKSQALKSCFCFSLACASGRKTWLEETDTCITFPVNFLSVDLPLLPGRATVMVMLVPTGTLIIC